VLETDGLPNSLTMNFWDSTNKVAGLQSGSGCQDTNNKTISNGGFKSSSVIPSWTSGLNLRASPFLTTSGVYSTIPAGMVGEVYSTDPSGGDEFYLMMNYWTTSGQSQSTGNSGDPFNSTTYISGNGCNFNNNHVTASPVDIQWFPSADVFGNQLNPSAYTYQSVTLADGQGHILENGWTNYHAAVLNATDNAAYQARTNASIPVTVFTIGLGGNSTNGPPDPVLLQRMANDPNGDFFNNPVTYQPCAQETGCATFSSQPQGEFVYSPNASNLGTAFLRISSQVLRLSK
jgi:hypothetical protein